MENNRNVWITLSKFADVVCDLLPSNKGRQSLVSSLTRAYGLDLKCAGVIAVRPANSTALKAYHEGSFLNCLLTERNEVNSETESDICSRFNVYDNSENYENQNEDESEKRKNIWSCELHGLIFDCPVFPFMREYVKIVAGSSLESAKKLIAEKDLDVQNVVLNWYGGRHHAHKSKAQGFCYVNDIVLSITLLRKSFRKVFYLDLDLHHGDGVENAYRFSNLVVTCSIHRYEVGFYPGTGDLKSGLNTRINIPTKKGLLDGSMHFIINHIVSPLIEKADPNVFVIQAGVDGLATDEHREWNLTIRGYTDVVTSLVKRFNLPCLVLGGGGYNHTETAKCWTNITKELLGVKEEWDLLPEHDFLDEYESSGYQFWTPENTSPKLMKDQNDQQYLNHLKSYIHETYT